MNRQMCPWPASVGFIGFSLMRTKMDLVGKFANWSMESLANIPCF
ncbi:unnamed protein product [Arabidopsis lyrata]|nr:unnamed protein product [Arabidopsis lyrata]